MTSCHVNTIKDVLDDLALLLCVSVYFILNIKCCTIIFDSSWVRLCTIITSDCVALHDYVELQVGLCNIVIPTHMGMMLFSSIRGMPLFAMRERKKKKEAKIVFVFVDQ
jgi:hypothetical protein